MKANTATKRVTHALIFELEYIAVNKRLVEFDSLKSAVGTKGVELTQVLFARSGMLPVSRASVTSVLKLAGKKTDAIEKAVNEVEKAAVALCEKGPEVDAGLVKLIKACKEQDIAVLAFTALTEENANKLMKRLGLDELGVELIVPDEINGSFPRADAWLKMLKKCDKEDATLVALVSSQVACKGALTAGAACVAIPDQYTDYQDFGGSKLILESLSDVEPQELFDLTLRK